jgi:hypothetical protein
MSTQEQLGTRVGWQPQPAATVPEPPPGLPQERRKEGRLGIHEEERAASTAPPPPREATRGQPCPERIWWFGVLVGGPMMLLGFLLILTLVGAPLGIPLWASCATGWKQGTDPGLAAIWGMQSETEMAWLSVGSLAVFATATLGLALRVFNRSTMT